MKKGIDISYHQGTINFSLLKANNVQFIIIREGYGKTTDPKFFEYVQKANQERIPIIGVYHFSYALNEDAAREEARFCINNVRRAGLGGDILVFEDLEYDTIKYAISKGVCIGNPECNKHTVAFCEEVRKMGYLPGVYTNLDFYKNCYSKDVLSKYPVWLADYSGGPDFDCLLQQYSSKGRIPGIKGNVDLNYYYGEEFKMDDNKMRSRSEVVNLARSWIGVNEKDGSYRHIIATYNTFKGILPRGVKMQYDWPWCACTWSALAITLGYTDIMPIEISCGELVKRAVDMGCWKENDGYVPSPGDAVLYDWNDDGVRDNTGWPDHVGCVDYCNEKSGYMTVIEGNYNNAVKKRTISLNGKYIRGFITPSYTDDSVINESEGAKKRDIHTIAREVISGLWGDGVHRKEALEDAGFVYKEVQSKVNEILNTPKVEDLPPNNGTKKVETTCWAKKGDTGLSGSYKTTANLYCRNDAGTNKRTLCLIPKGTIVQNYGFYTEFKGVKWLLIQFNLDGILYTGFSSSSYLEAQ